MTVQIAVYGRLARDPVEIQTKTGTAMAASTLAVNVPDREQETGESTLWLSVVAFGKLADQLRKHRKGDLLSASGRLELDHYQDKEQWKCLCDNLVSARTVRPGSTATRRKQSTRPPADDELPDDWETDPGGVPWDDD